MPFKNLNDKLDRVLKLMEATTKETPATFDHFFLNQPFADIPLREQAGIKLKLLNDKMIEEVIQEPSLIPKYFITFEGLLLLENRGYSERKRKDRSAIILSQSLAWAMTLLTLFYVILSGISVYQNYRQAELGKNSNPNPDKMPIPLRSDTIVIPRHK